MNLGDLGRLVRSVTKEHLPLILSVGAGVGTLATAYLAARATYKITPELDNYNVVAVRNGENPNDFRHVMEKVKLFGPAYVPTTISAVSTVGCIVGANRVEYKKTLAAQTAFAVSQRVFSDYRDKVVEEYGERKEQAIRDKVADDRVKETAPETGVIVAGSGTVLCCELFTMRYFMCDAETLRRAQNDLNARLLAHDYATLSDFYYMIGLSPTSVSSQLGWKSTKQMNLQFSTALTEDNRPCLTFEYNYTEPL